MLNEEEKNQPLIQPQDVKILYIDGLNIANQLLTQGQNPWKQILDIRKSTKVFMELIRKRYNDIRVIIDAGFSHPETIESYKQRREKSIFNREILVPSCLSQYIGDAFREAGAPVYFCFEDREDTMANWASLDKAHILSSDKDFYKFTGDP